MVENTKSSFEFYLSIICAQQTLKNYNLINIWDHIQIQGYLNQICSLSKLLDFKTIGY
jgi:hypothetical protein